MQTLRTTLLKSIFCFLFPICVIQQTAAQLPEFIEWEQTFGGSLDEEPEQIIETSDGGFLIVGWTHSDDAGSVPNNGAGDYWVIKTSSFGTLEWDVKFGGSGEDACRGVFATNDGGYVLIGETNSTDIPGIANNGGYDAWMIKINSSGNMVWQRNFGGPGDDRLYRTKIIQTNDGGFAFCGVSNSNTGVNGNDFWVVKTNSLGIQQWSQTYGGNGSDFAYSMTQTSDGSLLVIGETFSSDAYFSNYHGGGDVGVLRLTSTGSVTWRNAYGGSNVDIGYDILEMESGSYLFVGAANSEDGDVGFPNYTPGGFECWVREIESNGNIAFGIGSLFGGTGDDFGYQLVDNGNNRYSVLASTSSFDGNVFKNQGITDYWLFQFESEFTIPLITWETTFGGGSFDNAKSVAFKDDGTMVIAGQSYSDDGYVNSGNNGLGDIWVVEFDHSFEESFKVVNSHIAQWGDYDNDGDLDFISIDIPGTTVPGDPPTLFRNDLVTFTPTSIDFSPLVGAEDADWADFDNDGDLDLVISGIKQVGFDLIAETILFENNSGSFNAVTIGANVNGKTAWGDYDNDGDLDLVISGRDENFDIVVSLYENDFGVLNLVNNPGFSAVDGDVIWIDYDNDGDLDLVIGGLDANFDSALLTYVNDNGNFSTSGFSGIVNEKNPRSLDVGDYDNDGDLDLLVAGYWNIGDGFTEIHVNNNGNIDATQVVSETIGGVASFGDMDNDGDLDIVTGAANIFENTGGGGYTKYGGAGFAYIGGDIFSWGDFDNDGDLDLYGAGDIFYSSSVVCIGGECPNNGIIYENKFDLFNTAPDPPTGLTESIDNDEVTFVWNLSNDSQQPSESISYNLYLYEETSNNTIVQPMSDLTNGDRRIAAIGSQQLNTLWTVKGLEGDSYCWKVQAIDHTDKASFWSAEQCFNLCELTVDLGNDTTICPNETLILDVTNPNATYEWSTGESNSIIEVFVSDIYMVTVTGSCVKSDTIEVMIDDVTNPTAICKGTFSVDIEPGGELILTLDQIDNGSFDDCAMPPILSFSNINPNQSEYIINCDDVGQTVQVFLYVSDESGNEESCWTNINVDDSFNNCFVEPTCRNLDSLTLVTFYNATHENGAWVNEWDLNQPMDTWFGVQLSPEGCVECLDLDGVATCFYSGGNQIPGNNLRGEIPPEIGDLTQLRRLLLANNDLYGNLPATIGNLDSLQTLDISLNSLSGNLPTTITNLTNLFQIDLAYNGGLTDSIPSDIGNLSNLLTLKLDSNQINGNIPVNIGSLSNLEFLSLSQNNLIGTIPSTFSGLSKIEFIKLDQNQLSGEIPPELGSLTTLETLHARFNNLTGALPPELGNLTNLTCIDFFSNQLEGCFPSSYEIFCPIGIEAYFENNPNLSGGGDFNAFCLNGAGGCDACTLSAHITVTNTSCGLPNGTATVNVSGGSGDYSFLWSTGDTTQTIMDLDLGTYSVTVIDGDCEVTASGIVSFEEAPVIEWERNYGGSEDDSANSIQQTQDGGYIIAGYSSSNDGDVVNNYGGTDYWILKLDESGFIEWERNYGGSEDDSANAIQQTQDGGYIIAGRSSSNDGDVGNNYGGTDYWILKLDKDGFIEWEKNYGGSEDDLASSIQQIQDGGYIIVGHSRSNDIDVNINKGDEDYWIIKIGNNGMLEWEKSFGGGLNEYAHSIQQTHDQGFIVAGHASSPNGDITNYLGAGDFWITKINANGILEWEKSFGGSSHERAFSIQQTLDEGYIIAGFTGSDNGDVSENNGFWDFWIVKTDKYGILQWEKNFGGSNADWAMSIQQTIDEGFIVAGFSNSSDIDIDNNKGLFDYWILKLDKNGELKWENNFGGSDRDYGHSIVQTQDIQYIIAGVSGSNDYDVSGNNGGRDYWIVKLTQPHFPQTTLGNDTTLCLPDTLILTATDPLCPTCTYLWSDNNTDSVRTVIPTQTTTYSVTLTNETGCTAADTLTVTIDPTLCAPENDDCTGIIDLGTAPICQNDIIYSNFGATESDIGNDNFPLCWNGAPERDVWFSFTSNSNIFDYNISVIGCDNGDSTSIMNPEVALYRGFECGFDEMVLVDCRSANDGEANVILPVTALTPGIEYFIRVNDWSSTGDPNWGAFKLCVEGAFDTVMVSTPATEILPSEDVCLDVSVGNFSGIQVLQFSMNFDPTVLQFNEVQNFNLPNFSDINFGGQPGDGNITMTWSASPSSHTLSDGTTIFQVCFTAIGDMCDFSPFDFTDNPLVIVVRNHNGIDVPFSGAGGDISIRDTLPPELLCNNIILDFPANPDDVPPPNDLSDNCTFSVDLQLTNETIDSSNLCQDGRIITRTWVAVDSTGNQSQPCEQQITIVGEVSEVQVDLTDDICDGNTYEVGTETFTQTGEYQVILTASNGCDSIVDLDLTVHPVYDFGMSETLCFGDSITIGNEVFNATGDYPILFQTTEGCDSLIQLDLTVLPFSGDTLTEEICTGESIQIGNETFDATGNYEVILTDSDMCDSVVTLNLLVRDTIFQEIDTGFCAGGNILIDGMTYDVSDTYFENKTSWLGCDSIIQWNVTVWDTFFTEIDTSICFGEDFTIGNSTYTQSGIYFDTLMTFHDCDSIFKTILDVIEILPPEIDGMSEVCQNEILEFEITNYDSDLNYTWTFPPDAVLLNFTNSTATIQFGTQSGDVFVTADNDCGTEISNTIFVNVNPNPNNPNTPGGVTDLCINESETYSIPTVNNSDEYLWTTPLGDFSTNTPELTLTWTSAFQNQDICIAAANDCDTTDYVCLTVSVYDIPTATLSGDAVQCPNEMTDLEVNFTGDGPWTIIYNGIEIQNIIDNPFYIEVSPDQTTEYVLESVRNVWCDGIPMGSALITKLPEPTDETLEFGICEGETFEFNGEIFTQPGEYPVPIPFALADCDSVIINLKLELISDLSAKNDEYILGKDMDFIEMNVLENDNLPSGNDWTFEPISNPNSGKIDTLFNLNLLYTFTNDGYEGLDSFEYVICQSLCCDTAKVILNIETKECFVVENDTKYNVFTPYNYDGLNDLFNPVAAFETCDNVFEFSELTILNRWGEIIYRADPYEPWDGTNGTSRGGPKMPGGTYFYQVKVKTSNGERTIRGSVLLLTD